MDRAQNDGQVASGNVVSGDYDCVRAATRYWLNLNVDPSFARSPGILNRFNLRIYLLRYQWYTRHYLHRAFTLKALANQLFNLTLHHLRCKLVHFRGLDFLLLRKGPPNGLASRFQCFKRHLGRGTLLFLLPLRKKCRVIFRDVFAAGNL